MTLRNHNILPYRQHTQSALQSILIQLLANRLLCSTSQSLKLSAPAWISKRVTFIECLIFNYLIYICYIEGRDGMVSHELELGGGRGQAPSGLRNTAATIEVGNTNCCWNITDYWNQYVRYRHLIECEILIFINYLIHSIVA